MRLRTIQLTNFMMYDEVEIELPKTGVVLVTGENGEGKSSLVEAVAAGCWGKTLRSTPWWREGKVSEVDLSFYRPDFGLHRRRTKGGSSSLSITNNTEYDTATKAQQYVDETIPPLDVWRKTSVFTSAAIEGKNYSSLGDGGQKRLLEIVVGLNRFDPALKLCRADMHRAEKEATKAKHDYDILALNEVHEEQKRKGAVGDRDTLKVLEPPKEERIRLGEQLDACKLDRRHFVDAKTRLERAGIRQQSDLTSLKNKLGSLSHGNCPTCSQLIPDQLVDEVREEIELAEEQLIELKAEAEAELEIVTGQVEEIQEQNEFLRNKFAKAGARADQYEDAKNRKAKVETVIRDTSMALGKIAQEKASMKQTSVKHEDAVKTLLAVEQVLGLKGVRAHVFGQTIGGLAAIANKWLHHMGGIQIQLASSREKKDGGITYENEMIVEGAGGGFGYKACSLGQRRRIDVSLLLGLAKISSAAYGMDDSTMFFDEVFDILDGPGRAGVAVALAELAERRCVVVISHADGVQQALSPVMHLHVESGQILEM